MGFLTASYIADDFLQDYVSRHKGEFQDQIKLWLVGYSRGGAAMNLLAGQLDDAGSVGGVDFRREDLYAYCFEPPMGAQEMGAQEADNPRGSKYDNIHNIVNPADPVPLVAPQYFNFARYGNDKQVIPTPLQSSNYNTEFSDMLGFFYRLQTPNTFDGVVWTGSRYIHKIDTFQGKTLKLPGTEVTGEWTQPEGLDFWEWKFDEIERKSFIGDTEQPMPVFLINLVDSVAKGIGSREHCTYKLQDAFRVLATSLLGNRNDDANWNRFRNLLGQRINEDALALTLVAYYGSEDMLYDMIASILQTCSAEAGIDPGWEDLTGDALKAAVNVLKNTIMDSISERGADDLLTLFYNADLLGLGHYPELCLAWLQSKDPNYTDKEVQEQFVISGYRVIRINCPVDVEVFDSSGALVAAITDDKPQEVTDSWIVTSFSADGEKLVYLPADEDYRVVMTATGDGTLSYAVQEYSSEAYSYAKLTAFHDVPITTGDVLEAAAPRYTQGDLDIGIGEGTSTVYTLAQNGSALTPDVALTGTEQADARYQVTIRQNIPDTGMIAGGGSKPVGTYAAVSAAPYAGCTFDGWYRDGTLVCSEWTYRFRVEEDVALEARFAPETYTLTVRAGKGGAVTTGAGGDYGVHSTVTLAAEPDAGYRFAGWSCTGGVFADSTQASTEYKMPREDAVITAAFEPNGGAGGDTELVLSQSALIMSPGSLATLDATRLPSQEVNRAIVWTSSDSAVVTVTQEGLLRAVQPGVALVTAATEDGAHSAICRVRIIPLSSSTVEKPPLGPIMLDLMAGETAVLDGPEDTSEHMALWFSSNPDVVSVSQSGTVTALSPGTATVTLLAYGAPFTAEYIITVTGALSE